MGGRQVWRGHDLCGWCLEERQTSCTTDTALWLEGAEPEEALRLPGGLYRTLLRIPQPLEEPKACGEGVPESSLELRGRWVNLFKNWYIGFFVKNSWLLRSWKHNYNAGAGMAQSRFCVGESLQSIPDPHLDCGFHRLWILCFILVLFSLLP